MTGSLATGMLVQGSLVITGVLTARALGMENRGRLALLQLLGTVIPQVVGCGLPLAVTYEVANTGAGIPAFRDLRLIVVSQMVLTCILAAVATSFLPMDNGGAWIALSVAVAAPAVLVQQYAIGMLQGQQLFLQFNLARLAPLGSYAAAVVGVVLAGRSSLRSVALAWATASVVAAGFTSWLVWRRVSRSSTRSRSVKEMLAFGVRGFIGWLSPIEGLRIDQQVVGFALSPVALGAYVVAQAFTNLPRFIAVSIGAVAHPHVASEHDVRSARRLVLRYSALSVLVCGSITVGLAAVIPWAIPVFFGTEFIPSIRLAYILLPAAFFMGVRRVLAEAARGLGLPGTVTITEVVSWIALMIGVIPLAASFGAAGVSAALVLSSAIGLGLLVILVLRAPRQVAAQALPSDPGLTAEA